MSNEKEKAMHGRGAEIHASVDEALRTIKVSCDPLENAIQALSDYLSVLRKTSPENILLLEALESVRFDMKTVLYRDRYPAVLVNDGNGDIMVLPVVETFHYMRILQRAMDSAPSGSIHEESRSILTALIAAVDTSLKSRVGQEYDEIKSSRQAGMNYLYIRYLDYMYDCFAPEMKKDELPTLFTLLCKQIMHSKKYSHQEREYLERFRIYEYDGFMEYCDDWLERNYEEDIFLEDVIMDMGYPKCGLYRNFTYE